MGDWLDDQLFRFYVWYKREKYHHYLYCDGLVYRCHWCEVLADRVPKAIVRR